MTVLARIFAHALASPDRAAVTYNGRPVSYHRLAAHVALTRAYFEDQGVGPDRAAVVCLSGILDAWVARLALRSLGVTTVAIRSTADLGQLGLGPATIVAGPLNTPAWAALPAAAAAAGHRLISMPDHIAVDWRSVDLRVAAAMADAPEGGHILLTSGTTGAYKKVLYDAEAEAQLVAINLAPAGVTSATAFNLFNFPSWTVANYTWAVLTWHAGGAIALHQGPDRWRAMDPAQTHAVATPQMLTEILAAPASTLLRNPGLRLFLVGGVVPANLWREARARLTDDLWSIYGSTESAHKAYTPLRSEDDLNAHATGEAIQVVDNQDQQLPPGQPGAVRLRTTGVPGYLNDPESSAAFFRNGYFYPGDLGVRRDDGRLVLQGRLSDVINVQGAKIASLPLETMLQERFGATAVCIFSVPGDHGESVHVAVQSPAAIATDAIAAALAAALPGAGPIRVHAVATMPRNTMGKVERAALKASLLG